MMECRDKNNGAKQGLTLSAVLPRCGVSQLVAVVLIVAIAIAAGIATYSFIQSYVRQRATYSSGEPILVVESCYWRGALVAHVSNQGTGPGVIDRAYIVSADGSRILAARSIYVSVPAGGVAAVIVPTDEIPPGNYVLMLSGHGISSKISYPVKVEGHTVGSIVGIIPTAASIHSPLEPVTGFDATFYDITGLPTIPEVSEILKYGKVIKTEIVEQIDFTDHPSYGGTSWGLNRTDRFAAVFRGFLYMRSPGTCSFNVVVDDGIVIYVDGEEVLKSWRLQAPTSYAASIKLDAGRHNVTICYFENYGIARLKVSITVEEQYSELIKLKIFGKYFSTQGDNPARPDPNKVLNDKLPLIHEGYESSIDYIDLSSYKDTYGGEPWPFQDGHSDLNTFAAHWVINVTVLKEGTYLIRTLNDDGVIVYVDGSAVISDWGLHAPKWNRAEVYLSAGTHRIDVIYYENYGIARMYFSITYLSEEEALSPTYIAKVYDISSYSRWSDLSTLYDDIVSGAFPLIGEYGVEKIDFSDSSSYPADPWFFTADYPRTDYFAVVFDTSIHLSRACTLVLNVVSDDGVKVIIDGEVVLEDWSLHAPRSSAASKRLAAGTHTLRIVYFERTGIARLKVELTAEYSEENVYPDTGGYFLLKISDVSSIPSKFYVTIIDSSTGSVVGEASVSVPPGVTQDYVVKVKVKSELPAPGVVAVWHR